MDAVKRLLEGRDRHEDQIRQDLVRMLDELDIENLLSYRTPAGPADIYLPRRRVFIETKGIGLADNPHAGQGRGNDETPFEQVTRYLTAEMNDELGSLFASEQHDLPWTGIVTDGRTWHAWQFPHTYQTEWKYILPGRRFQNEDDLLQHITPIVKAEQIGKPWIPTDPVPLFSDALDELQAIYRDITNPRVRKTTETKKHLWLDILRGSGMAPENPYAQTSLFITHCFLVTLAKGVVYTVSSPDDPPNPNELLCDGYLAWIIEIEPGRRWAQQLLNRVHDYEWRRTAGDVLRPLYEGLVEQNDRRDFGEVYTPDWLAEMMVEEVLDEEWCNESISAALTVSYGQSMPNGIGVLDPTCGSGTFLYHCAKRILTSKAANGLSPVERSDVVCRLVHGIDIHPVAVEFARATLLRALPTLPSIGLASLAIYQGDALMLRQTDETSLFAPQQGEILIRSPKGNEIRIPREFSDHRGFPGMLPRIVEAAVNDDPIPSDIAIVMQSVETEIVEFHKSLAKIIKEEGNSVWTWYIQNILGPDRLAMRKVNRIVANPPWVKLANIQVQERKRELESTAGKDQLGDTLWVGGKQAPHFDIAQLFIHFARSSYLNQPETDPGAWVTKASAIRAGNWKNFREIHEEYIAQILDFSSAKVFGGGDARRSCVIFEIRRSSLGNSVELKAECVDSTPEASMSWEEVRSLFDWKEPIRFP
ncbi:MAG: SAM-dependent DNA methyltransferase, partial [Rhodothermaceae bacterium]|nr:SAM-dependent DNA methyltransferase [Rhodothermaceae bacterium]